MKKKPVIVLAADIGGSHITSALVDLEMGRLLERTVVRATVRSDADANSILDAWSSALLQSCDGDTGSFSLGLAMPGPFDYENGVSWIKDLGKYERLYGLDIRQLLALRLGIAPKGILFENDAACFLQGEILAHPMQMPSRVLGFTLGTGFGSAYAVDGIAKDAELWKMPHGDSIAENCFSTRWFLEKYTQFTGNQVTDVATLCELVLHYPDLQVIFDEFGRSLAAFLTKTIIEYPADRIVIGGNIAKANRFFLEDLGTGI